LYSTIKNQASQEAKLILEKIFLNEEKEC